MRVCVRVCVHVCVRVRLDEPSVFTFSNLIYATLKSTDQRV